MFLSQKMGRPRKSSANPSSREAKSKSSQHSSSCCLLRWQLHLRARLSIFMLHCSSDWGASTLCTSEKLRCWSLLQCYSHLKEEGWLSWLFQDFAHTSFPGHGHDCETLNIWKAVVMISRVCTFLGCHPSVLFFSMLCTFAGVGSWFQEAAQLRTAVCMFCHALNIWGALLMMHQETHIPVLLPWAWDHLALCTELLEAVKLICHKNYYNGCGHYCNTLHSLGCGHYWKQFMDVVIHCFNTLHNNNNSCLSLLHVVQYCAVHLVGCGNDFNSLNIWCCFAHSRN